MPKQNETVLSTKSTQASSTGSGEEQSSSFFQKARGVLYKVAPEKLVAEGGIRVFGLVDGTTKARKAAHAHRLATADLELTTQGAQEPVAEQQVVGPAAQQQRGQQAAPQEPQRQSGSGGLVEAGATQVIQQLGVTPLERMRNIRRVLMASEVAADIQNTRVNAVTYAGVKAYWLDDSISLGVQIQGETAFRDGRGVLMRDSDSLRKNTQGKALILFESKFGEFTYSPKEHSSGVWLASRSSYTPDGFSVSPDMVGHFNGSEYRARAGIRGKYQVTVFEKPKQTEVRVGISEQTHAPGVQPLPASALAPIRIVTALAFLGVLGGWIIGQANAAIQRAVEKEERVQKKLADELLKKQQQDKEINTK